MAGSLTFCKRALIAALLRGRGGSGRITGPAGAGADLCRSRRPRAGRAGRRPGPGRRRRRGQGGARAGPQAGHGPLLRRGRPGLADPLAPVAAARGSATSSTCRATPRGKAPKLRKGSEFLLLAAPVAGRPGELRLVAPDAQIPFTAGARRDPALDHPRGELGLAAAAHRRNRPRLPRARRDPRRERDPDLPPDRRRHPGLADRASPARARLPLWAVALSEIVDEAAAPPAPGTLLWYRLACGLPRALPRQSLAEADAGGRGGDRGGLPAGARGAAAGRA